VGLVFTTLATNPSSVLGTNLLVNGNAEAGPNATPPAYALYIPAWSTSNDVSVAPYGGTNWIQTTDPGPPDEGVNLFWHGADGGVSTMYQDIDVSPAASLIDASLVTFEVSAWLGAVGGSTSPTLTYSFFDWSANQLAATATLGPFGYMGTGVYETSASGTLPANTRRVRVTVSFPYGDTLADNIAFTLAAPGGPPVIAPGGIMSAGDFGAFFLAAAPGSWIEIYGHDLTASAPTGWSGSNFNNGVAPTKLGDVSVSVGGTAAYIDYISPGQVNVEIPSDAPISSGTVDVTLTNSHGTSSALPIYLYSTLPGLLAPSSFTIKGKQYVVGILSDGSYALPANAVAGVASRPAMPGETVTMYGVGFGPVTPEFDAGTIVTGQNSLTTSLQMMFGNTPAALPYEGLAPSLVGLYQFNVVVPNIGGNDATLLSIKLGGYSGLQKLYIAVGSN